MLLQIEQQELKRQRENLMLRKKLARREFDEGVMLLTNKSSYDVQNFSRSNSNGDIQSTPHYENVHIRKQQHYHNPSPNSHLAFNNINNYRKSMPNLQEQVIENELLQCSVTSPISPLNANYPQQQYSNDMNAFSKSEMSLNQQNARSHQPVPTHHHHPNYQLSNDNNNYSNRQALMQICAVPKPKLSNEWVQYRKPDNQRASLNSHWLIQEAEQRRIEQMNGMRMSNCGSGLNLAGNNRKSLPDSVIHTVQRRVQDSGLGVNVSKR